MAIKVVIPADRNVVTAQGAYQWDYGQVLEITSSELGSEIVEVHFACQNMTEAIVCSCSFSNGFGTVTIPNRCLEQTSTLTAWIYRTVGTTGYTWKAINISITARTRPSKSKEVPQEIHDKYTELVTEINEAIGALERGDITVEKAKNATNANHAASAGTSATANYAVSAGSANNATNAVNAQNASNASIADYAQSAGRADWADRISSVDTVVGNGEASVVLEEGERGVYVVLVRGTPDRLFSIVLATKNDGRTVFGTEATRTYDGVLYNVTAMAQYSETTKRYNIHPLINGVISGTIEGLIKIAHLPTVVG